MQVKYHIGSKPNSTNYMYYIKLIMNLYKQTAFHARHVCSSFTCKQIILARLQWLFPVVCCTSGPFSRAEEGWGDSINDSGCHLDYSLIISLSWAITQVIHQMRKLSFKAHISVRFFTLALAVVWPQECDK